MKKSAGILLFRCNKKHLEVLLVHPGGPFWKNKDLHAWSIPKGEFNDDEDALAAAKREFEEELGLVPTGDLLPLNPVKQNKGKTVYAWALEGDFDAEQFKSNYFEMEWPPRSGNKALFPEIDKATWFNTSDAKEKILEAQVAFLDELLNLKSQP